MAWFPLVHLTTAAMVLVSEPDSGKVNYLFKFQLDGAPAWLETTGDWGQLVEGATINLQARRYVCEQGVGTEKAAGLPFEIPIRTFICSANPDDVLIDGRATRNT
jgi:hypothetical protein